MIGEILTLLAQVPVDVVADGVAAASEDMSFKDFLLWIPIFITAVAGFIQARKGKDTAEKAAQQIATGNGKTAGEYLPAIMDKLHEIQLEGTVRDVKIEARLDVLTESMDQHMLLDSENMLAMIEVIDSSIGIDPAIKADLDRRSGSYLAQ